MYTELDYTRFNLVMNPFAKSLEYDRGRLYWTGFKIERDDDDHSTGHPDRGAVGQWCGTNHEMTKHFYVNLPGMQSGERKKGEAFDVGTARVFPAQDAKTILDTKAMIRAGLAKLHELIEAEAA